MPVHLLLITGTCGAGKSSVAGDLDRGRRPGYVPRIAENGLSVAKTVARMETLCR